MPIKLPNLDDRTFADLLAEAHALIPVHAPEWTNHNESDPGITLVELFAYLTEIQIYRLNRVTDANLCAFLQLIDGIERSPSKQNRGMVWTDKGQIDDPVEVALRDEVRDVVLSLRQQDRAVTCEDFERLALAANQKVARAYCVPQRDLTASSPYAIRNADISVVIVPAEPPFDRVFWFDGKDFADFTSAAAGLSSGISFKPPAVPADARLYLGATEIFESLSFALLATGTGYTLAFEYFNGKDWIKLDPDKDQLADNTSNWSSSGLLSFTRPPDWALMNVNDTSAYWLRISTSTVPSKVAVAGRILRELVDIPELVASVSNSLDPRRLLTTRVHVVTPRLVTIKVNVNLALKADAIGETVTQDALGRLGQFLNQQTWPFGRNLFVSEIYRLLDRTPGVDFITRIDGTEIIESPDVGADRLIRSDTELVAIKLNPDELVNFSYEQSKIIATPPQTADKIEE